MLRPGTKAPDFSLKDTRGRTVKLSDFKKRTVVVYFYPKDDTPGCTKEACNFRDHFQSFGKKGITILGISPDSEKSHQKFINKFDLPFLLLSDPDHKVAMRYGAWGKKKMYGREYDGILRSTFIIDGRGKISLVFDKVKVAQHATDILAALEAKQ